MQRARHEGWQHLIQIDPLNTSSIRRFDLESRAMLALAAVELPCRSHEIAHALSRRLVAFAGRSICCRFHATLKLHTCQHVIATQVSVFDVHEQCRIRVAPVASMAARAVHHNAAQFRRRAHNLAAWAHAERVHAAVVAQMHRHFVIGRAKRRMARRIAVLRLIDELLGMLDSHAHRKRLALHEQARIAHAVEHVARRMAARENHITCRQNEFLARAVFLALRASHSNDASALEFHAFKTRAEAHLAAPRDNLLAHSFHDINELVGANVRLAFPKDFFRGARLRENMQHVAATRILDVRGELAVGKCARAALAELHVRFRVQGAAFFEGVDGGHARIDVFAALKHDGRRARFREAPCREQARRAHAHHNGTSVAPKPFANAISLIGSMALDLDFRFRSFARQSFFDFRIGYLENERRREMDIVFPTRIDRKLRELPRSDIRIANAQCVGKLRLRHAGTAWKRRVERQIHIACFEHRLPS